MNKTSEALRRIALHVDHAIRTANRLVEGGICDGISTEQAAWLGVLRGDLAEARDILEAREELERRAADLAALKTEAL